MDAGSFGVGGAGSCESLDVGARDWTQVLWKGSKLS